MMLVVVQLSSSLVELLPHSLLRGSLLPWGLAGTELSRFLDLLGQLNLRRLQDAVLPKDSLALSLLLATGQLLTLLELSHLLQLFQIKLL